MTGTAERRMTVDEFLAWDDGTETRYELVDGVAGAMAPPMSFHGTIQGNAHAECDGRLAARPPCRAILEAGVRIGADTFFVADVATTCAPVENEAAVRDPALLVEVLSPSTRAQVLLRKLPACKLLPTVREIWLIDSERRWAQVWWREAEGWHGRDLIGPAGFRSRVLDDEVALDRLYRNTTL
jgi:Uma2 family endonuclease